MTAVKQAQFLIAYCHPIPIEKVDADFTLEKSSIKVSCTVLATAKTGVEMEALVGTTLALNTIWDMAKYLEKDDDGQYPSTAITDIKVVKKVKGE